ncbi:spore cortex-lytic enzyme [Alkalibacillus haloalkaliphilus]|uniref:Spore cortex-lytic enzyme n=2 Tax=Alkalibacillus haloalkaliphilus TaxID=94136 RepID=A0A511W568_9BACI|nr:spore cortex-lytic enzyme [Alkalibacillus haloalkaliphilus]
MRRKHQISKIIMILTLCVGIVAFLPEETSEGFSEQVIQKGATGDDVVELQSRLQYIGFYNGRIDGVYGWETYWAVRNFQDEFGLEEVDGLVGEKTKDMLIRASEYDEQWIREQLNQGRDFTHYGEQGRQAPDDSGAQPPSGEGAPSQPPSGEGAPGEGAPSQPPAEEGAPEQAPGQEEQADPGEQPEGQEGTFDGDVPEVPEQEEAPEGEQGEAVNVPGGFSQNDIQLMAQAVYAEGRGEPYNGQVAIAGVILNRIEDPEFPDTISGIIFEPLAFEAVDDGQIYMEPDEQAREAVMDAINGWDPSGGATYYFNPDTATSDWIWSRPQIKRIGKHIFMN